MHELLDEQDNIVGEVHWKVASLIQLTSAKQPQYPNQWHTSAFHKPKSLPNLNFYECNDWGVVIENLKMNRDNVTLDLVVRQVLTPHQPERMVHRFAS